MTAAISDDRIVLPANVRPVHYNLRLQPNFDSFIYSGSVKVELKVQEPTDVIVMNAKDLELLSAKVTVTSGKAETVTKATNISLDTDTETASITFPDGTLIVGATAMLDINFNGHHSNEMTGFYRSVYTDADDAKKTMLVTQFEATDARKAFPCWDEPALKATFDTTLVVDKHLTALGNMDVVEESADVDTSKKVVKFGTTPVMSTYLLAFAVGEFEYLETTTTKTSHPIRCRVYTTKGLRNQGKFALDFSPRVIEYFTEVFGLDYPLPKMDMLAVPDFAAGAMENWGLVTYRTSALLWDPEASAASAKMDIAYTVAHELAHQWFGNLVTMQWWNELWLNEGFATWVGWLAVDKHFPDWDIWTHFLLEEQQPGLGLDAMRSSHPIEVPVKSANEIDQIFDAISYCKGGSVIRMLSSYLTNDVFLAGIRRYLKKHAYGNASTADLWAALSEESGLDVGGFMDIWTKTIGYPVLTVVNHDNGTFTVRQNRYLSSGDVTPDEDTTCWWVPLGIVTNHGPVLPMDVLTKREATFALPESTTWFKLNGAQAGNFRVQYSADHVARLGQAIKAGEMVAAGDRVGVISDMASLAQAGMASTADLLALLECYSSESEYIVWSELASRIASIKSVWFEESKEVTVALDTLERKLFASKAHAMGWEYLEGEAYLTAMLRSLVIARAGLAGDEQTLIEARARFARFVAGEPSALHPDIREAVYAIVVKHGGEMEWEMVKDIYLSSKVIDQKLAALHSLGATRNANLIQRLLALSFDDAVRPQDITGILRPLAGNPKARYALYDFVKSNWSTFETRYRSSLNLLGHVVKCGCGQFSSESMVDDIRAFFASKDTSLVKRPLEQSIEKVQVSAWWLNRARDDVSAWATKQ